MKNMKKAVKMNVEKMYVYYSVSGKQKSNSFVNVMKHVAEQKEGTNNKFLMELDVTKSAVSAFGDVTVVWGHIKEGKVRKGDNIVVCHKNGVSFMNACVVEITDQANKEWVMEAVQGQNVSMKLEGVPVLFAKNANYLSEIKGSQEKSKQQDMAQEQQSNMTKIVKNLTSDIAQKMEEMSEEQKRQKKLQEEAKLAVAMKVDPRTVPCASEKDFELTSKGNSLPP